MNTNKTYFLVSGWDFPVGSITLGSVISSPTQPHLPLFTPAEDDIGITHPTTKKKFTGNVTAEKADKAGLFFRFLDMFGLGAEASYHYDRKTVLTYSFRKLNTNWFVPSDELKKKATKDNARVASFCRDSDYEASVYMITGLKTVEGAGVTTSSSKSKGWKAFLGLEAGPVNVGPSGEHNGQMSEEFGFENSTPIVFAFQLLELKLSETGEITASPFNDGALFDAGGADKEREVEYSSRAITQERLDEEFGQATFEIEACVDEEDDSPCLVVAPKKDVHGTSD
ncbi:hypothetical protein FB567DRAFT_6039 [Paraphoma chrysanthemicola]|uniref:Uncharacterized protein n=1 Tax=Paraphoma chrysanthemicola TaxID=798071 RepID=A0A8K0RGS3_9PLEO|nr:hypothetical protein FB567DRAFT_6039 [Paraphoma chrysanthemicola]